MNEKKLLLKNFTGGSRSYISCLYSLLTSAGLYSMPKYMLSGMTGMLFKFIIHSRLLPSSLDMYRWQWENWHAVNILGIYNETYAGSPLDATLPLYRKQLLHKIKSSVDEGRAAVGWGSERPQFCLYTGYNDEDQVLFYRDSPNQEEEVLLYENFGLAEEGDWFVQIIGGKIEKDIRDVFRESLEEAVREWHSVYKMKPEYGSGKKAYQNLLDAFQSGDFNYNGAYYMLKPYLNSKMDIARYMDEVIKEIPELSAAAELYRRMAEALLPLRAVRLTGIPEKDKGLIPEAIGCFRAAMLLEDNAVNEIEKYLRDYMHNRSVNPARLKELY
jgi:hypothetical protein